ncbi:MAG: MoaD/ThiS family protein [Acidobacteria bacterium]|nr:MoaD/ThiS family protein [Acidobacteriota bacterium]
MEPAAESVVVRVLLPSLLRACTGGRAEVSVAATTFAGAVERLVSEHPALRGHLFDDAGKLREHVSLFLNDEDSRWLDSWQRPLVKGDVLTVIQAVSGG